MDLRFYFTLFLRRIHYVILLTVLGAGIGGVGGVDRLVLRPWKPGQGAAL